MVDINERNEKLSEIENYKQLSENFESGKTLLIDYNNKTIECNQFGIPLIKYYREITGQKSYKCRLEKGLVKKIKYESPQYIPNTPHFIGSSKFPRPLSIPFLNQIDKSKYLIDAIKKGDYYSLSKNKSVFELEKPMNDSKALPNYFCVKLGMDSPKTRKYLINLFDEKIQKKKEEYNNDQRYYQNDSVYKGLVNYRKSMKDNLTKNLLNGNKIPYTKQKDIYNKFKIIRKLIKKDGWNKMHIEKENINHDLYNKLNELYKKEKEKEKSKILKKNLSCLNPLEINRRRNNENLISKNSYYDSNNIKSSPIKIKPKKNNALNALISPRVKESTTNFNKYKSRQQILSDSNYSFNNSKNNSKYFSFQGNINKSLNGIASTMTTGFNSKNDLLLSKNIINKTKYMYSPKIFHYSHSTLSEYNKKYLENNNKDNNNNEDMNNLNEEEKKSNISNDEEINNKKTIKKLNEIKQNYEHESKLLKGYQPGPETEEVDENTKIKQPKLVSPSEIFKKEMELFKKVNPIEYEKELKKKLLDEKILKRKLQNKKIFERLKIKK